MIRFSWVPVLFFFLFLEFYMNIRISTVLWVFLILWMLYTIFSEKKGNMPPPPSVGYGNGYVSGSNDGFGSGFTGGREDE
jgi:hypothetical protein